MRAPDVAVHVTSIVVLDAQVDVTRDVKVVIQHVRDVLDAQDIVTLDVKGRAIQVVKLHAAIHAHLTVVPVVALIAMMAATYNVHRDARVVVTITAVDAVDTAMDAQDHAVLAHTVVMDVLTVRRIVQIVLLGNTDIHPVARA